MRYYLQAHSCYFSPYNERFCDINKKKLCVCVFFGASLLILFHFYFRSTDFLFSSFTRFKVLVQNEGDADNGDDDGVDVQKKHNLLIFFCFLLFFRLLIFVSFGVVVNLLFFCGAFSFFLSKTIDRTYQKIQK